MLSDALAWVRHEILTTAQGDRKQHLEQILAWLMKPEAERKPGAGGQ